ncbi:serine hydrolase domain-containing protein [Achromobacter aloeverae]
MQSTYSDGLNRAAPATRGIDASAIQAFLDGLEREELELHSFMFWKDGAVIAEGWWAPYAPGLRHMLHSSVKSFVGTGIGLAVDRGLLALDAKVADFFPEHVPPDAPASLHRMTVRHLLTMTSGHGSGISGGEWRRLTTSWIADFFKEPMVYEPGERFVYCSGCSYMLAAILQKVTGERVRDWMAPRFFEPLGIEDLAWDVGPDGVNTGGNGIRAKTSDLLKLALVHMQGGQWQGQQLLSPAWTAAATGAQIEDIVIGHFDGKRYADPGAPGAEKREGYGFQWWRGPDNTFTASGLFGQHAIAFPDHNAVIAFTGGIAPREKRVHRLIWENIVADMQRRRAPDAGPADADARLARRLAALSMPIEHGETIPASRADFHAAYAIAPNDDNVARIALACRGDDCTFTLTDDRGAHEIAASFSSWRDGQTSMTGWRIHHSYQPDQARVLARAFWRDEQTLVMDWIFVETAFRDHVVCRFDGDEIRFDRRVNTNSTRKEMDTLSGRRLS